MSELEYTECEIDVEKLASDKESFEELHGQISGRSTEYNTITEPVAENFSGLIGAGLRGLAKENEESWSSALLACEHAYGVIEKVIEDVKWYEDEIDKIKLMLSNQLEVMPPTGNKQDDQELRNGIIDQKIDEAEEAWDELERRCQSSEDFLSEGPTPENIRALVEAGHLGNISFYTTGDVDYYTLQGGEAEHLAEHIERAMEGDEESLQFLEDDPMALALLASIVNRSLTAKEEESRITGNELDFLEELYGSLGEEGFIDFIDEMNDSDIPAEVREELNRNLSNGMLSLSDEDIGGGMELLPEDVREVSVGPEPLDLDAIAEGDDGSEQMDAYYGWQGKFETLSEFLGSSGSGVRGGTDFSTALLATASDQINYTDFWGNPIEGEVFQDIIGVAARNPEANNIMLTGRDFEGEEYEFHEYHEDVSPDSFLGSLYTYDWPDDGQSVAKITDWIETFQKSDDPDKVDQGSNAFVEFLDTITSEEMQEKLSETDHSVEDEEHDITWENVSFTHLNPEIADSFADLFLNNMEAMESVAGFNFSDDEQDESMPPIAGVENEYRSDGQIVLDPMTRLIFTEYIAADENSASRLSAASFFRTEEGASEYFSDYPPDESTARNAGILSALVDHAIDNEHERRVDATNEEIDYKNEVSKKQADMVAAVFNEIPAPGVSTVAEVLKMGLNEAMELDPVELENESSEGHSAIILGNRATLHAAIAAEASGQFDFEDVEILRDPESEEISLDPHDWFGEESFDPDEYQEAIDSIRGSLRDNGWPGAENELGGSVLSGFGDVYGDGKDAFDEHLGKD